MLLNTCQEWDIATEILTAVVTHASICKNNSIIITEIQDVEAISTMSAYIKNIFFSYRTKIEKSPLTV